MTDLSWLEIVVQVLVVVTIYYMFCIWRNSTKPKKRRKQITQPQKEDTVKEIRKEPTPDTKNIEIKGNGVKRKEADVGCNIYPIGCSTCDKKELCLRYKK